MKFAFTPDEAQATAETVAGRLSEADYKVSIETAIAPEAPYRTTLLAKYGGLSLLIEAQGRPSYEPGLRELAMWLRAERLYCELSVAVNRAAHISLDTLANYKRDGLGIVLVNPDGTLTNHLIPRNTSLTVKIDETLALGKYKTEIADVVERFNAGDRKAALREMCDLVERETGALTEKAANKAWLSIQPAKIAAMDWSDMINVLHSPNNYAAGRQPILDSKAKDDLHSFRGARNLVDHPAKTKVADLRRQRQYPERMLMGPRLLADLLSIQRKVK